MGKWEKCGLCDFRRQVKTLEENQGKTKAETWRNLAASVVCINPDSPHYGERRKRNALPCSCFHDWFYRYDGEGDKAAIRKKQSEYISKYRRDVLGLEPVDGLLPM
jgi:hypothetical protein